MVTFLEALYNSQCIAKDRNNRYLLECTAITPNAVYAAEGRLAYKATCKVPYKELMALAKASNSKPFPIPGEGEYLLIKRVPKGRMLKPKKDEKFSMSSLGS